MVETSAIVILRHDDGHAYISTTYALRVCVWAPRNDMRILYLYVYLYHNSNATLGII